MDKVKITLSDGQCFYGESFGAPLNGQTVIGELVFATGMTGYIETLTDPSYFGQIVMQTFPMIGNYGMIEEDRESKKSYIKAYVVREWCDTPSNFRCEENLDAFLKNQGITGVCGVDTRQITRTIRENGVMNAMISSCQDNGLNNDTSESYKVTIKQINNYVVANAVMSVSRKKPSRYPSSASQDGKYKVALIDYGAKHNIIRELNKRECDVTVLPHDTPANDIIKGGYDGLMLSNGPGDPAENKDCIKVVSELFGKIPMFGICLGHQIMALAAGARTEKLKYGHRGLNQPVKNISSGRVFISSQNHGYAVVADSIPKKMGYISYLNANDGSCEGAEYPEYHAFSVQFHPEASCGPHDTMMLFDKFTELMSMSKLISKPEQTK